MISPVASHTEWPNERFTSALQVPQRSAVVVLPYLEGQSRSRSFDIAWKAISRDRVRNQLRLFLTGRVLQKGKASDRPCKSILPSDLGVSGRPNLGAAVHP
jgi:hypothetical protein